MPIARRFREASEHVFRSMPQHVSIVNSSILSAIEGRFGDHHATDRTWGSELFINPLMAIYWCFQLVPVAGRVQYLERIVATEDWEEVRAELARWEAMRTVVRPAVPLPL